jgi:hypothetical protein
VAALTCPSVSSASASISATKRKAPFLLKLEFLLLGDLPDSYFQPTAGEAQKAFAGQTRAREKLVDGPLLTRKLREQEATAEAAKKKQKFPTVSKRGPAERTLAPFVQSIPRLCCLVNVDCFLFKD